MIIKNFLSLLFIINLSSAVGAWENSFATLNRDDIGQLLNNKYAYREDVKYKKGLELMPSDSDLSNDLYKSVNDYDPDLCVELLYVVNKPDVPEDEIMLYLLNKIRSFNEMEGLTYYSDVRMKDMVLIKKNYFVDDKNRRIKDPVADKLPGFEESVYYQDESTFGGNYYNLITRTNSDTIWLQMENRGDLNIFLFFNAIEKKGQRINFFIKNSSDKILIYALSEIKKEPEVKEVFGIPVIIGAAFKKRMDVILSWYIGAISE